MCCHFGKLKIFHSSVSCEHLIRNSSFSQNSQSRFGQFSCLPFFPLWPRPSALPLPDHLVLLEVSRVLSSHRSSPSPLWVVEFPRDRAGRITSLHLKAGSQSADSVTGTKSPSLSHLTLLCSPHHHHHLLLLSEWFNVTPCVRLYLSR